MQPISITQIKEWYKRFKNACTSMESVTRSSRLSTSQNVEIIDKRQTLVVEDCCHQAYDHQELTDEVGISVSVSAFLYQRGYVHVESISNIHAKAAGGRAEAAAFGSLTQDTNFLNTMIPGDES